MYVHVHIDIEQATKSFLVSARFVIYVCTCLYQMKNLEKKKKKYWATYICRSLETDVFVLSHSRRNSVPFFCGPFLRIFVGYLTANLQEPVIFRKIASALTRATHIINRHFRLFMIFLGGRVLDGGLLARAKE